jgi:hypothetical protein
MKYRVTFRHKFGDIVIESETSEELVLGIEKLPNLLKHINEIIAKPTITPSKASLNGIIHFSNEGPLIIVPRERLSDRDAISLLLYAMYPDGLTSADIGKLLSKSGRYSRGYAARISEMKREGKIVQEGNVYKLTVHGTRIVEETIIPSLS